MKRNMLMYLKSLNHLQRKKTTDDSQETVDVSEESEPEPESVRGVEPSSKSISQTEAKEAEAARQVHATYARIVTESVPKPTRRRKLGKVTCDPPKKLKGVPSLTLEEQEAVDIMQALKESKRQLGTEGSSKETGTIPGVPDESIVISATSSEGTGTKPGVPDKEKEITEENDEDEEMINAEVDDSNKGGEKVIDAVKADDEKTSEVKDDPKKTKLPPTSSIYLTVKDTTNTKINSLLEVKIQSEVLHTQSLSILSVPISVISKPTVLTPVQESPSIATATTLPPPSVSTTPSVTQQTKTPIPTPTITTDAPIITTASSESDALSAVQLRATKLEKGISDLKKIDLSAEALAALKTQVPSVVDNYLGSKVGDTPTVDLEQGSEKSALEILKIKREQAEKQQTPTFTIKSTDNAALQEYDQKKALIEDENTMDKGVVDTVQDHKRKHDVDEHDDDEDPLAGPHQGKALSKGSKTSKSTPVKEPVEEPITEVVMDDAGNDVVHDEDQPQDASEPKTTKTPNPY
ncbi:hypothetical protein Tco_0938625 [Tanacetum coccineum]|uniref:Uncharacterized protein n=1 Tax=Tanacetum coccineum TaxID=301880 RepID=A0ABQ5DHQ2_9ASTR